MQAIKCKVSDGIDALVLLYFFLEPGADRGTNLMLTNAMEEKQDESIQRISERGQSWGMDLAV